MNPAPYTFSAVTLGIIAIAILGTHIFSLTFDRGDRLSVRSFIDTIQLEYVTAVAITAMAGSLIMSEVVGFIPCRLCWIQRGFMYPAAFFLLLETLHINLSLIHI